MADSAFIEEYYLSHDALYRHLVTNREVSFASDFTATFTRGLVLAIASFFEHEITEILTEIPAKRANGDPVITAMITRHAIARKYHTHFDWENLKPGPFWALLGDEFKAQALKEMKDNENISLAIRAFLELGQLRNRLVHQNYVQFVVDKTPKELIDQFRTALGFPIFLRTKLLRLDNAPQS